MARTAKLPPLDQVSEAILICNGLSARGYEAPAGVYTMVINDGIVRHRADAAVTVDCPGAIREAWHAFKGDKVVSAHMPEFPTGERFDCLDMVRRWSSATPVALAWLHLRKGARKVTVVGLDSLWGEGAPGAAYNRTVVGMLVEMAQYFPDGLFVRRGDQVVRVGEEAFGQLAARAAAPAPAGPRVDIPSAAKPGRDPKRPPVRKEPVCRIPQTMVEFDVSPRCTRKCGFCAPGIPAARRRQKKGLSLEAHNAVVDELVALGYDRADRWLCYCGHGEPLMSPDVLAMVKYARRRLPAARIAVYTNVDRLDDLACRVFEAHDVTLVADLYDAEAGPKLARVVADSCLDPESVHVVDHTAGGQHYSSRCSSVKPGGVSEWLDKPCRMPEGKLFITDDRGKPAALLCCEDYARESLIPLGGVEDLVAAGAEVRAHLAAGRRRKAGGICLKCDRDGGHPAGFDHVPRLTATAHWPPPAALPKVAGRRLVVMTVNRPWAENARVILDAVERASVMPGENLVIWNDLGEPPAGLAGPGRTLWVYKEPLGWCGINRGIARALQHAVAEGYDWVIKLDTDTAVMRKGWDALLCAECPRDCQAGTYMDVTITGQLPGNATEKGLFNRTLEDNVPWARRMVRRGRRGWDHIQGGCYVIGVEALRRIDAVVGLGAEEQEALDERLRVGEDVYLDTKCKLSGVRQVSTLRARSWYREPSMTELQLPTLRYHRDVLGVCAEHPVKTTGVLRTLAEEVR